MLSCKNVTEIFDVIELIKKKHEFKEANLWSLIALGSCKVNLAEKSSEDHGGKSVQRKGKEEDKELERQFIEWIVKASKDGATSSLKRAAELLDAASEGYWRSGYHVISIEASLVERGLFSAGSSFGYTMFEVGLSFDWLLNLPFIASSSIKGAVKSAWRALHGNDGDEVFGNKHVGSAVFMDAYPVSTGRGGYILYPDVLTPHYSKEGSDIFDETEAFPVPVAYLTVAPQTVFRFQVAVKGDRTDLSKLLSSILYAFKMGLGAKTAVGYGVFDMKPDRVKVKVAGGNGK